MPEYTFCSSINARPLTADDLCLAVYGVTVEGLVRRFKENEGGYRDDLLEKSRRFREERGQTQGR